MATTHRAPPMVFIDNSKTRTKHDYELKSEDDMLNRCQTWTLGIVLSKYVSYYTSSLLLNVLLIAFYVV